MRKKQFLQDWELIGSLVMGDDNSNKCIDNTEFADGFGFGFDGLELPNDIDSGCIVLE